MLGAPSPRLTKPELPFVLCLSVCVFCSQRSVFPSLFLLALIKASLQLHFSFLLLTMLNPPPSKNDSNISVISLLTRSPRCENWVLHKGKDTREWEERFAGALFSVYQDWCSFRFHLVFTVLCLLLKRSTDSQGLQFPFSCPIAKGFWGNCVNCWFKEAILRNGGRTGNPSVIGLKKNQSLKMWFWWLVLSGWLLTIPKLFHVLHLRLVFVYKHIESEIIENDYVLILTQMC